tara:strand:- start:1714 stop:2331 length:618 start_codon:yes stop_codon:yes gene_type:complete
MADELQDLPPEERIKRLKELEKKRKKEIADAQEKIKESEDELRERLKWTQKVPIPEFAQENLTGLSEEAKEILKADKNIKEKVIENEEPTPPVKEEFNLEEAVGREEIQLPPEIVNADYTRHLSQEPMRNLYTEMAQLRETVEEKGYMSSDDERKVEYTMAAIERKRDEGYSFTEETARAASITQQIGAGLRNVYKSSQSDVYRS